MAAVDLGTMFMMQGAMTFEEGMARLHGATASPAVQAQMMENARMRGAMAAENIRNRYYKKEFEQIMAARVNPLLDEQQKALETLQNSMQTTVMPVKRTISAEESQMLSDELQPPMSPDVLKEAGNKVKEAAAPPNVAMQPGMVGAIEVKDELAIRDPVSGEPIPLSSPRGINIWQSVKNDYWSTNARVNQELMKIMSEYQGNPYADNYSRSLMDNVIKQSNIAATGIADPMEAQTAWQNRMTWEADQEIKQQEISTGMFNVEKREADLAVDVNDASRLINTDKAFKDLIGDKIANKLMIGKPLTRRESLEASSAVRTYRTLQEKMIAQRARERIFTIPTTNINNPENWPADIQKDEIFDTYKNQFFNKAVASALPKLRSEAESNPEGFVNKMRMKGVPETDIQTFMAGGGATPAVTDALKGDLTDEQTQVAYDSAYLKRLPELERQQPELSSVMDSVIENAIMGIKGLHPEMTPEQADILRQDRYRTFFEVTTGRAAPEYHDPFTLQRVATAMETAEQAARPRSSLIPEEVPVERPEEPTGPLAPEPLSRPAPINLRNLSVEVERDPSVINKLSQKELEASLRQLNWILVGHKAGKLSYEEHKRLINLKRELNKAYITPVEKVISTIGEKAHIVGEKLQDFFTTSDEEKQQMEQKRQRAWIVE